MKSFSEVSFIFKFFQERNHINYQQLHFNLQTIISSLYTYILHCLQLIIVVLKPIWEVFLNQFNLRGDIIPVECSIVS